MTKDKFLNEALISPLDYSQKQHHFHYHHTFHWSHHAHLLLHQKEKFLMFSLIMGHNSLFHFSSHTTPVLDILRRNRILDDVINAHHFTTTSSSSSSSNNQTVLRIMNRVRATATDKNFRLRTKPSTSFTFPSFSSFSKLV